MVYSSTPNGRHLRMRMKTQRETPFHLLFKLFLFIYQHKETYVVVPKIESENIACIVPHKIHYCFGSHLRISGETPINLINQERWQAPLRAERKHSKRSNCCTPHRCQVELFSLFLIQNQSCGCSKELSQ